MIFALEGDLDLDDIAQVAKDLGMSRKIYDEGEKKGRFLLKVKDDIDDAKKIGVTAVPVIFVNGLYFSGSFAYDLLKKLVQQELDHVTKQAKADKRQGHSFDIQENAVATPPAGR
jgi:predicted DsbA family dithiol-disulfide isomerase